MISQIDIRYSVSNTIDDVRELVNAFPGNITFCLETHTLYEYTEYSEGDTLPEDDGRLVLQTVDSELSSRWIATSAFTNKTLRGPLIWEKSVDSDTYFFTVKFPNPVGGYIIKFLDSEGRETWLEEVVEEQEDNSVTSVTCYVGSVPDCRFDGYFYIQYSGLV